MAEPIMKAFFDAKTKTTTLVEMTPEEIAEMQAVAEIYRQEELAREAAQAEVEAAKASANAKLEALGLTPEEIAAITGA